MRFGLQVAELFTHQLHLLIDDLGKDVEDIRQLKVSFLVGRCKDEFLVLAIDLELEAAIANIGENELKFAYVIVSALLLRQYKQLLFEFDAVLQPNVQPFLRVYEDLHLLHRYCSFARAYIDSHHLDRVRFL